MSRIVAPASPKLTYQEQAGAGQSSSGVIIPGPWMWTVSPPRVRPDAGEMGETVTSADSVDAAAARTAAARRILISIYYGLALRIVPPATSQPSFKMRV